jgi:predicted AAA+ superfamily ATPase
MHNYSKRRAAMPNTYVQRSLEPVLPRAADEFPAVLLTGPRQAGKTTLLKHVFAHTHGCVSLEHHRLRPEGFEQLLNRMRSSAGTGHALTGQWILYILVRT